MPKIKVLIVDDSAVIRQLLSEELSNYSGIQVIGSASNAFIARNKIINLQPDVVTLDIQMPEIDGLTFLKKIMKYKPIPVIIFSSYTKHGADLTLKALEAGAIDFVQKPSSSADTKKIIRILADKIKQASRVTFSNKDTHDKQTEFKFDNTTVNKQKVIAIGASTGGTVAITKILMKLPPNFAPIVIVQHMPPYFTKAFADRLDSISEIKVKEAEDNDRLNPGMAIVAPGDHHMELAKDKNSYIVTLNQKDQVHNQRPSVEVLFNSVAKVAGKNSIGIILTGMGYDGAKGLLNMKNSGAYTITQDKDSSVVFGMPKKATQLGAACKIANLYEIPDILINKLTNQ